MRGALLWIWLAGAAAELVFHVPDVLVRHAGTARAVGTAPRPAPRPAPRTEPYEEYFVEHEISTRDARKAAKALRVEDVPVTEPGCGACSARELEYCDAHAAADHCCCEYRYREPFPWIPHTCYLGPGACQPRARNCATYARLRACCCDRRLAEKWKSILASSARVTSMWSVLVATALCWLLL